MIAHDDNGVNYAYNFLSGTELATNNHDARLRNIARKSRNCYITDGYDYIPAVLTRIDQSLLEPMTVELTVDPFVPVCFETTEHIKNHSLFSGDPIKKVIYNAPNAVIVFWTDGTKTVVKCSKNDTWDPEKGLAMAIAKKFLGNKGNYNNILKKHLTDEAE